GNVCSAPAPESSSRGLGSTVLITGASPIRTPQRRRHLIRRSRNQRQKGKERRRRRRSRRKRANEDSNSTSTDMFGMPAAERSGADLLPRLRRSVGSFGPG